MIALEGVTKRYGSHTIVAPFDWELETGKTHVLIGPSGCGKSTLLRLMHRFGRADRRKSSVQRKRGSSERLAKDTPAHGVCHSGWWTVSAPDSSVECFADGLRTRLESIETRVASTRTVGSHPFSE